MTELQQKLAEHRLDIVKHLDTYTVPVIEIIKCVNGGWSLTTTRTMFVASGSNQTAEKLITDYIDATKKLINQT